MERYESTNLEQLEIPTDLKREGAEIAKSLRQLLADVFALYLKTKNFHWNMSGSHFRDYHLLLDEHGDRLFAMTDPIAERGRKIGCATLRSIGDIARHQRLTDNEESFVGPKQRLTDLCSDNRRLTIFLQTTHAHCDRYGDVATASLLGTWIDETERRAWFLAETAARS